MSPSSFIQGYKDRLSKSLAMIDDTEINRFIEILKNARERNAKILFIGNGGSASTASHFANDLAIGSRSTTPPFRALSLCDNVAITTALGNDFDYDQIFSRQLALIATPGDVVVAISASGNSPNLLNALETAQELGLEFISLLGFDGGKLKQSADFVLCPTEIGDYGVAEDCHLVLNHIISSYFRNITADES